MTVALDQGAVVITLRHASSRVVGWGKRTIHARAKQPENTAISLPRRTVTHPSAAPPETALHPNTLASNRERPNLPSFLPTTPEPRAFAWMSNGLMNVESRIINRQSTPAGARENRTVCDAMRTSARRTTHSGGAALGLPQSKLGRVRNVPHNPHRSQKGPLAPPYAIPVPARP